MQQCNVPLLEFDVTNHGETDRIGRNLDVIIESFHTDAEGGGLLYFGVEAAQGSSFVEVTENLIYLLFYSKNL